MYAAYRMGQPREGSTYIRPLIVKFTYVKDRNRVWKLRNDIPQVEGQQKIKIQADLPKQLRDDVSILYRVIRAASAIEEYKTAIVRDYAVVLHGKQYTARQLEVLPAPIRPSSLAYRESEQALVFFSRFSPLSNHHPSTFTLENKTFLTMEQYLAFKRAELAQNEPLMEKAMQVQDPAEAKSILNALRTEHAQEWQDQRADITVQGLKAKFGQNEHLADYLRNTKGLPLGEASRDPCWTSTHWTSQSGMIPVTCWGIYS